MPDKKNYGWVFSRTFIWGIVGVGILLRLRQYLFNRSLWSDEAALALNILDRSYTELLQPLASNQVAPIGFLFLGKCSTHLFGKSEYALRLIPLLAGILALVLSVHVAFYFIRASAVPMALGLFALSTQLIHYASELKQYSSDACITLLLYTVLIVMLKHPEKPFSLVSFGLTGAAALWFSHPAVFVLAGIGSWLLFSSYMRKAWKHLEIYAGVIAVWLISFGLLYLVSLRHSLVNQYLQQYWNTGFMPLPPKTLAEFSWFFEKLFKTLGYLLGLNPSQTFTASFRQFWRSSGAILGISPSFGISQSKLLYFSVQGLGYLWLYLMAAAILLFGIYSLYKRDKNACLLLLAPILFVLLASGVHAYPVAYRLLLYTFPIIFLFCGEGIIHLWETGLKRVPLVGVTLILAFYLYPGSIAAGGLIQPWTLEENRPVLRYLKEHWQQGDLLYVYYSSEIPFQYYSRRLGLDSEAWSLGIKSRENWEQYLLDLDQLRGHKRVWLFFSHAYRASSTSGSEEDFCLAYLDRIGTRLDVFTERRAAVYLYNLEYAR